MAYTFPLSVTEFIGILGIQQIKLDTPPQIEVSQTGGGEIISADLAPMLWLGEVRLGIMTVREAADPEAFLDILRPAGRSFYAYDTRRPAPLLDPTGSILGASVPTIHTLIAGSRDMRLAGLPVGYQLSRGDYLAFDYGTAPVRRALHRVVSASAVMGATFTGVFEVTPMLRPGVVTGTAVTLIKPACKAVLIPGSVDKGSSFRTIHRDMMFRFQQTLR